MSENMKRLLREDIACHEASLFTTPHLSRIHHAEAALLALLEEKDGARDEERRSLRKPVPLKDALPRLPESEALPPHTLFGDD